MAGVVGESGGYERRQPELTVLYEAVLRGWPPCVGGGVAAEAHPSEHARTSVSDSSANTACGSSTWKWGVN